MSNKRKDALNNEKHRQRGLEPRSRFSEFKESGKWSLENLGARTTKVGSGITPTGGDKTYTRSGRPFIRSQNVGWGELLLGDVAFIDEETHASFVSTQIHEGDVLLNITGASIGRSALADSRVAGGNVNQHVCVIRVVEEELNPVFLNQFLLSQSGQVQIDSFQAGGNRQGLNFAQVRTFSVPIPPTMGEQIKVSCCLSSIDELITVETRKLNALKVHKLGLMQQLFPVEGKTIPPLRFPEFHNAGEWQLDQLGQRIDLLTGYPFDGSDIIEDSSGTPLMRGINITEGFVRHNSDIDRFFADGTDRFEKYRLQEKDLVVGMDGSKVGKNSALITKADAGALLVQRVARLRSNGPTVIDFVFSVINSKQFHRYVDSVNTSSGIPHISAKQISEFEIAFPSPDEQQKIADFLSSWTNMITAQSLKVYYLEEHKKGLMYQLFPVMDAVQL